MEKAIPATVLKVSSWLQETIVHWLQRHTEHRTFTLWGLRVLIPSDGGQLHRHERQQPCLKRGHKPAKSPKAPPDLFLGHQRILHDSQCSKRQRKTPPYRGGAWACLYIPECISAHETLCFVGPLPLKRVKKDQQNNAGSTRLVIIFLLNCSISAFPSILSVSLSLTHFT